MKNITYNDYVQRINKVVAYINNHLDETLDLKHSLMRRLYLTFIFTVSSKP